MMEILSKGTWFESVISNVSAKNCFRSNFNYAHSALSMAEGSRVFQDEHLIN